MRFQSAWTLALVLAAISLLLSACDLPSLPPGVQVYSESNCQDLFGLSPSLSGVYTADTLGTPYIEQSKPPRNKVVGFPMTATVARSWLKGQADVISAFGGSSEVIARWCPEPKAPLTNAQASAQYGIGPQQNRSNTASDAVITGGRLVPDSEWAITFPVQQKYGSKKVLGNMTIEIAISPTYAVSARTLTKGKKIGVPIKSVDVYPESRHAYINFGSYPLAIGNTPDRILVVETLDPKVKKCRVEYNGQLFMSQEANMTQVR